MKVLDFGLAKVEADPVPQADSTIRRRSRSARHRAGVILGTAAYMAPEQAEGKPVDKRADIWAFGVVLYEMVTGRRLFPGETTTEILASVLKEEPQWDRVPSQVQRLLRRCLEKDPERRLRHIGDAMELVDEATRVAAAEPRGGSRAPLVVARRGSRRCGHRGDCVCRVGALHGPHRRPKPRPRAFRSRCRGIKSGTLKISPDGRRLAYYGLTTDSGMGLLVRDMGGAEWRLLASAETIGSGN